SSKALDLNMPNREVLQDCCNPDFFNTIGLMLLLTVRDILTSSFRHEATKKDHRSLLFTVSKEVLEGQRQP
ncbi:hypothetical protein NKH86_32665, partial [Mesorhizobium sp. M0913]|uniref:hypothetical protein n=1 Tax=Mesorhizobium sp. M0913 TaxID=2957026 RepID=UPI00333BA46F